jgi:hypothetical protein
MKTETPSQWLNTNRKTALITGTGASCGMGPGFMNKMLPPSVRVLLRRAVTRIVRNPSGAPHA